MSHRNYDEVMHPNTDKCSLRSHRMALSLAMMLLAGGALTGCSTSNSNPTSDSQPTGVGPVSMINGAVPPGTLDPLQNTTTMLDTVDAQGDRLFVVRGKLG